MICRKTEGKLKEINEKIQICTNCELHKLECNVKDISKGYGKLYGWKAGQKCRFMFLGMNPSYVRFPQHEYAFGGIKGTPGPGEKFNSILKETGVFDNIFCDNIVHCSSLTNEIKLSWAQSCFTHLFEEIKILQPKKIIVMGKQVNNILNSIFIENNIKIPISNIWHPSYVFSYRRATVNEYKEMIIRVCD